jgi:hypothetical protein
MTRRTPLQRRAVLAVAALFVLLHTGCENPFGPTPSTPTTVRAVIEPPPPVLQGAVVDRVGRAVAEYPVVAEPIDRSSSSTAQYVAVTDFTGTFRFFELPRGTYRIYPANQPQAGNDMVDARGPGTRDVGTFTLERESTLVFAPGVSEAINPEARDAINPDAAKVISPEAARTLNSEAARTLNPAAAATINPEAAATINAEAARTITSEAARTISAEVARVLDPARARTLTEEQARTITIEEAAVPPNVLYRADWLRTGTRDWTGSRAWSVVDGTLVNDGSTPRSILRAPWKPSPDQDYAVEAELRGLGCTGTEAGSGYGVMYAETGDIPWFVNLCSGRDEWVTHRTVVKGNLISQYVDGIQRPIQTGNLVLWETTHSRRAQFSEVGLFSDRERVEVRSFTVLVP